MRLTDEEIMQLKLEQTNMELHLRYVKNLEKGIKKISETLDIEMPLVYKLNAIRTMVKKLEEIM